MIKDILVAIISFIIVIGVGSIIYFVVKPLLIRSIKHKETTTICPKCGSTQHRTVAIGNAGANLIMGTAPHIYSCQNCRFQGVFPIIDKKDVESFRKELKNTK